MAGFQVKVKMNEAYLARVTREALIVWNTGLRRFIPVPK
jgi:hypothetical protein